MTKRASGNHATTDRLSERAHKSVDHLAKTAGRAETKIRKESADAEARFRDAGQRVKQRSDETVQSVSTFVRDNPVTSLGLAFSAGVLLSALRRRP